VQFLTGRTAAQPLNQPNHALEPTPTAFARASLRLLARLTASVGLRYCTFAGSSLRLKIN
jgi:hypothetical protein